MGRQWEADGTQALCGVYQAFAMDRVIGVCPGEGGNNMLAGGLLESKRPCKKYIFCRASAGAAQLKSATGPAGVRCQ